MNYQQHRDEFVGWIRTQIIGPASEDEILRDISPIDRFPTGILYPISKWDDSVDSELECEDEEDEIPEGSSESSDNKVKSATKRRRFMPPSSAGFSFFVKGDKVEFQVQCSAVRYEPISEINDSRFMRDERGRFSNNWKRIKLVDSDGAVQNYSAPLSSSGASEKLPFREPVKDVMSGLSGIDVVWRPYADGWIITVTLFNKQEIELEKQNINVERPKKSLFEVELRCIFNEGEIGEYPRVDKNLLDDEEQELEIQYKHRKIYAVGHGAAVSWKVKDQEQTSSVNEIYIDFFPTVEVPHVTADVANSKDKTLQLSYLSAGNKCIGDLEKFIDDYDVWANEQKLLIQKLDVNEQIAAGRIVQRIEVALVRMRSGVKLLEKDVTVAKAFSLANEAMLNQMFQYERAQGKEKPIENYRWRPFQLAFILCVLESVVDEESDFRDTLDLIWFPTGGGKTEAYLGLVAFLVIWRRLNNPTSGGGTTALMRYTLRLLTAQQFQRATRMICALELIRRKNSGLGEEPITIGMWVGAARTPNGFHEACQIIEKAVSGKGAAPMELVLDRCPWCLAVFKAPINYIAQQTRFNFRCVNPNCEFSHTNNGVLPCNVVDEALYVEPPTLLIATIDKFARLAWEERTNAFFGKNGNRPPELIIQDELHLISGALGSIAGLYEAALDSVLIARGIHPKYIASTATIRMADQQVKRLYSREVSIFPPPGISCENSYFAKTISLKEKPGRLYVGYLAPMLDRLHCMVPLAAALLMGPEIVFADDLDEKDLKEAWWTQVVYHSSLKGVGNSHNSFVTDVRDLLVRYYEEIEEKKKLETQDSDLSLKALGYRANPSIAQLTSISSAEENATTFSRLERSREDEDCLDAVLATNMISVGLDVSRLALMIINGQPLTTAEYIQASSRIGRSEVPGIVFVNYYRDQARSLSHYENFRPFHESFYRFVEPTSVTPYTYQARLRGLHAALVVAVRHSCSSLLGNSKAGNFDPSDMQTAKVIEILKHRCSQVDKERALEVNEHIDQLVEEWKAEVELCKQNKRQLVFSTASDDKVADQLLCNHDDNIRGRWPTLQSLRNVENTALLKQL